MSAALAKPLDIKRVEHKALIPNWFNVGGRADRLARPESIDELRTCLRTDPNLRVLGDGANILVDDAGVAELVVTLERDVFTSVQIDARTGRVVAGAGGKLQKVINDTTRAGLAGLEVLGGIPATIGGAAVMNAGGKFGEIGPCVRVVHALDRAGNVRTLPAAECRFAYRSSALASLIVTAVEFALTPADPPPLRARYAEILAFKKRSQPMADNSAGCCFKNPTLRAPLEGIGDTGQRISAGLLIDRAECKNLEVGGARVSDRHANFFVTRAGCRARDVMELIEVVRARVNDTFGVSLDPEVVIWKRACPVQEMAR